MKISITVFFLRVAAASLAGIGHGESAGTVQGVAVNIVTRSFDGDIHYAVEAEGIGIALKLMAQSQGYTCYEALCRDMNYTASDFEVSVIRDERTGHVPAPDNLFEGQRQTLSRNAFRFMRRSG